MNSVLKMSLAFACLVFAGEIRAAEKDDLTKPLELRQNERIVLLGGGFVEREQEFCILEGLLVSRNPKRNITVRNLGWSGDTVWAESRGLFDAPEKGYARMLEHLFRLKPTLIFLAYGANESQAGQAGLEKFTTQYQKLIKDLEPLKARLVLVNPVFREKHPAPYPDPKNTNDQIFLYSVAITQLASQLKIRHIDQSRVVPSAYHTPYKRNESNKLTTDGLRLTEEGYKSAAKIWAEQLGWKYNNIYNQSIWITVQEKLIAKNRLYFYRWRPQNITYLTLFRKHEQGNNAKETLMFDPLVEKAEREIQKLLMNANATAN